MKNVAVFGVPRSGTSWIGQLFNSSPHVAYRFQPIFAYSFEGKLSKESNEQDIIAFHRKLYNTTDSFVCAQKTISGNDTPEFEKKDITHLVWKEVRYLEIIENLLDKSEIKVIGVVRHPAGVLKSWFHAPREFEEKWDILQEWRWASKKNSGPHEYYGYEGWLRATNLFLRLAERYPKRFKLVCYEDLLADPLLQVKSMYSFINLPLQKQTLDFIKKSTSTGSNDPYGVFKNKKNGYEWVNKLPVEIISQIINDERFIEIKPNFNWVQVDSY